MTQTGLVVASHGRHCVVEASDGSRRLCHPRGKKNAVGVGDRVTWQISGDEGSVEAVSPRRNLLYRQDEIRSKSFAANLDQVLILLAAEPEFSEMQLTRALIACEAAQITPLLALNKRDLGEAFARAWSRLAPYAAMGYPLLGLSLRVHPPELDGLLARLAKRTTLVLGPSGVGKSTLINALVPQAQAATQEISRVLNTGKHTTTDTRWYWLDDARESALIDSPGFQAFGLHHLAAVDLAGLMPDLRAHLGQCRFHNCTHRHEPGCGVKDALAGGQISASRHRLYETLFAELEAAQQRH